MRIETRRLAQVGAIAVIAAITFAACSSTGAAKDDLLSKVKAAGKIVMSTDPEYPPQSALTPSGSYEGFDIDVGTEIAKRLGVDISFQTPSWEALTAGSWSGRWDFSVGSMTITSDRQKVLARRTCRQGHLRRPGHDVPAVVGRNPRLRDGEPADETAGRFDRHDASL